jgi:hypothetical protein
VLLSPIAYYTADPERFAEVITPAMAALIPIHLPEFWDHLQRVAAEDGITLLRQPDETVTAGLYTDASYAVAKHVEKRDYEHKNARYGALILSRALALARQA